MLHDPIDIAGAEPVALLTLPRLRPLPHPDAAFGRDPTRDFPAAAPEGPARTSTPLLSVRGEDVAGAGSPGSWPAPATDLSGAIREIAALRLEQIEKWGHTPEKDVALPLDHLPREARETLAAAVEDLQFHRSGPALATARARIRKRLLKAAALIAAAVDRLDLEPEDDGEWPEF